MEKSSMNSQLQLLRKAVTLIAFGLLDKEKLLKENPRQYPYSGTLQHGMNLFLAGAVRLGVLKDAFCYADEATFLAHYICLPVAKWFDGWMIDERTKRVLQEEPYYGLDALAYQEDENIYLPTRDCMEYLDSQDTDLIDGTDERKLYEMLKALGQTQYVALRKYIIMHPVISIDELRTQRLKICESPGAREALTFAYEQVTEDSYYCPHCGWTLAKAKYGYRGCSQECKNVAHLLTDEMKIDRTRDFYRLKKGIMRYFSLPGKLEIDIAEECRKNGIEYELWPQMDKYDIALCYSDGERWVVDAKAFHSPLVLREKIRNDGGFPEGEYDRGWYVIPDSLSHQHYENIINKVLVDHQPKVRCVSFQAFRRKLRKKKGQVAL